MEENPPCGSVALIKTTEGEATTIEIVVIKISTEIALTGLRNLGWNLLYGGLVRH